MNDNNSNMNHNDLDRQIRAALDAQPSPERLERLERFWREHAHPQRRRPHLLRRTARLAAFAAAALVLLGVSIHLCRRDPAHRPVARHDAPRPAHHPPQVTPDQTQDNAIAAASSPEQDTSTTRSAGRPPTAYERLIFLASSRHTAAAKPPSKTAAEPRPPSKPVNQLAEQPQPHQPKSPQHETPARAERPINVGQLVRLARGTNDRCRRAAILRRLLTADSEPALRAYLCFVYDPATRADALAAAEPVSGPPLARLLRSLNDDDKRVRFSAAAVLGHVDGPEISDKLIALVTRHQCEQPSAEQPILKREARPPRRSCPLEAWIALMQCRSEHARRFLAYASHHPKYINQYNRAGMLLAQMNPA
jgi:hypothetical protein